MTRRRSNLNILSSVPNARSVSSLLISIKDKDGFYFITGRMKRFIKILGNRVNLDELESFFKNKLGTRVPI